MKLFNIGTNNTTSSLWLLLLRVAVASFMLTHGWPKFQNLILGNFQFADPIGIGVKASLVLVVFAEVLCSILIFIGLATRLATIPLIINMIVVVFVVAAKDGFAKQEFPLLYLLIYITIAVFGPGKFSVDAAIGGRRGRR